MITSDKKRSRKLYQISREITPGNLIMYVYVLVPLFEKTVTNQFFY